MFNAVFHSLFRLRIISAAGLIMMAGVVSGQVTRPGSPLPRDRPGMRRPEVFEINVKEADRSKAKTAAGESMLKPARSGLLVDAGLEPGIQGTWDTLPGGMRIWRMAVRVNGAASLNLIMDPYRLNPGVRVYLYDPDRRVVLGAFSDLNNKADGILATGRIPGETLIVELQVPPFQISPGEMKISQVGCDFAMDSAGQPLKDGWFGTSGSCNTDIACLGGEPYRTLKNSVVRIVYMGDERCTGTLLNNTHRDGRNYVLTAEHCIHTEDAANKALFYFQYESPLCDGPDGSNAKSVSGATLRATGGDLDFSLLELLEPVPVHYHPYYAGWDASDTRPSSGFSIHHPQGDVKKISLENHPLRTANFGSGYKNNSHWLVSHWESGTTEAGSSGAAIFDAMNRVRGSLTGGQANCDNSINDYFQMFSHDWEDYTDPGKQLAYWLDPLETGTEHLDGFDPNAEFWESGDTLSNLMTGDQLALVSEGLEWGAWSGHNSMHISQFAEHFSRNTKERCLGMILDVADNAVASPSSRLVVRIWSDHGYPADVVYEKQVLLADLAADMTHFIEFDSIVSLADSFFAGYALFYGSPQDTFSVMMAVNRPAGIPGTAYVYDGTWEPLHGYTRGSVRTSFAVMPVAFDTVASGRPPVDSATGMIVFPNPADSEAWIEFAGLSAFPLYLSVYNLQGDLVFGEEYGPYRSFIRLATGDLRNGVYLVRAKRGGRVMTAKMVIARPASR